MTNLVSKSYKAPVPRSSWESNAFSRRNERALRKFDGQMSTIREIIKLQALIQLESRSSHCTTKSQCVRVRQAILHISIFLTRFTSLRLISLNGDMQAQSCVQLFQWCWKPAFTTFNQLSVHALMPQVQSRAIHHQPLQQEVITACTSSCSQPALPSISESHLTEAQHNLLSEPRECGVHDKRTFKGKVGAGQSFISLCLPSTNL